MVLGSSGEMDNQVIGEGWKEEREWGVCVCDVRAVPLAYLMGNTCLVMPQMTRWPSSRRGEEGGQVGTGQTTPLVASPPSPPLG